jgi:hypothetical protein
MFWPSKHLTLVRAPRRGAFGNREAMRRDLTRGEPIRPQFNDWLCIITMHRSEILTTSMRSGGGRKPLS